MKKSLVSACGARVTPWVTAYNESQRMALEADPTFRQCAGLDGGRKGLACARAIALISYRNYICYNETQSEQDPDKMFADKVCSYQQYQGRLSIGSGQLTGKGLFSGPRVESNYVTFQHSDYIFSVAGEELGFLGCTAIILLLLFYLLRVLYIASKARDDLGRCMCFGFFGLIALQSVSNIGMCLALLPVMGVTLPFFSAGGSSAICLYLGFGLVQSVYMRRSGVEGPRLHSARNLKINFRKLKV